MSTDPQTFRHRAEEVEAVQWTGHNADALRAFAGPDFDEIDLDDRTEDPDETAAVRESEHGTWRGLKPGDWVVRLDGGLYEFAAADFSKQYEPAPAAPVAAPPTGQAGLRERIAGVLRPHANLGGVPPRYELPLFGGATPSLPRISGWWALDDVVAAVLSVLPDTVRLHDEILTLRADQAQMRDLLRTENQRADAAIDRETTAEDAEEEHRLALSTALGLGTSAPWDAIRVRAAELAGQGAAGDRAAVLREAADAVLQASHGEPLRDAYSAHMKDVGLLRRMAAETQASPDPSWPRRAWDLGLLHKGGDPHHCPACVAQPDPPKDFICPGADANAEVLANPQPSKEA